MQPNSSTFELLHPKIKRWIWEQGWTDIRAAQEAAVEPILGGQNDVVISAGTASGKTEAAFLPIISNLLNNEPVTSSVLYLSPLKALINDQFSRMESLCKNLDIQVIPWHGDISAGRKKKFFKDNTGVLLITPESLEAILVNYGIDAPRIFGSLSYIVVDELHAFIGSERGRQLQSLLNRIENAIRRRVPRIALSATLSDMSIASEFLRPGLGSEVLPIASKDGQNIKLITKGYVTSLSSRRVPDGEEESEDEEQSDNTAVIADSLFQTLRGTSNLIFANSRAKVELYADKLRERCEASKVPNEFWAHHGNLSKELREDAEAAIKDKARPVSIVCTSTLEMGIDIGSVASIAQIGVPPSVSSMRQRLGRSGRRGEPAILRIYIQEQELGLESPIEDQLRAEIVQAIAMVRLLVTNWLEPPSADSLHLSTHVQQVLSLIAQYGGITAAQAWQILCKSGPFGTVSEKVFVETLRSMGQQHLLVQASDGLLLHGTAGEKIVNHYSFYTAFMTEEEYRLVSGGRTLGSLPVSRPLTEGTLIIFGGRRWRVLDVDDEHKVIDLAPATGGVPPLFSGQGGVVHDRVRQEMLAIYKGQEMPVFLDKVAKALFVEARENFRRHRLEDSNMLRHGSSTYLFCWEGDRTQDTIAMLLTKIGLQAMNSGIAIAVAGCSPGDLRKQIQHIISSGPINPLALASKVKNKISQRYHPFLSDDLLNLDFASINIEMDEAYAVLARIAATNE